MSVTKAGKDVIKGYMYIPLTYTSLLIRSGDSCMCIGDTGTCR